MKKELLEQDASTDETTTTGQPVEETAEEPANGTEKADTENTEDEDEGEDD